MSALSQATSGTDCWGQGFTPDALANLNTVTNSQCSSPSLSVSVDANNHITGSSFAYDAMGNMLGDGQSGITYSFDAENRLVKVTGVSGGPWCYVYDALGLRVAKISGGTGISCTGGTYTKLSWRGLSGDILAESDGTGSLTNSAYNEYVFFSGRRIASRTGAGAQFYYFADQLGSTRTITTGSGKNADGSSQTPGLLCYDQDYTPYGQEVFTTAQMSRLQTTACPPNYRFTGYEYDAETGLDYAFARYYSPRLGRFLSTDPLGGSVADLQSHNAYAYASNNPLNMIDPSGMNDCAHTSGDCGGITLDGEPIDTYGSWFGRSLLGYVNNGGGTAPCPTSDCTVIRIVQGGGGGTDIVQKLTWNDPTWSEHWGPDGSLTSLSLQIGYWSWKTTGYTDNTPVSWWVDFSQNVGSNLVHGVRNQGESFGSCVLRNASETTGGLHGVLVGAVVTTASAAIANASRVSVPWAGNASGGAGTVSGSAFIALTVARLVYYGSKLGDRRDVFQNLARPFEPISKAIRLPATGGPVRRRRELPKP